MLFYSKIESLNAQNIFSSKITRYVANLKEDSVPLIVRHPILGYRVDDVSKVYGPQIGSIIKEFSSHAYYSSDNEKISSIINDLSGHKRGIASNVFWKIEYLDTLLAFFAELVGEIELENEEASENFRFAFVGTKGFFHNVFFTVNESDLNKLDIPVIESFDLDDNTFSIKIVEDNKDDKNTDVSFDEKDPLTKAEGFSGSKSKEHFADLIIARSYKQINDFVGKTDIYDDEKPYYIHKKIDEPYPFGDLFDQDHLYVVKPAQAVGYISRAKANLESRLYALILMANRMTKNLGEKKED